MGRSAHASFPARYLFSFGCGSVSRILFAALASCSLGVIVCVVVAVFLVGFSGAPCRAGGRCSQAARSAAKLVDGTLKNMRGKNWHFFPVAWYK